MRSCLLAFALLLPLRVGDEALQRSLEAYVDAFEQETQAATAQEVELVNKQLEKDLAEAAGNLPASAAAAAPKASSEISQLPDATTPVLEAELRGAKDAIARKQEEERREKQLRVACLLEQLREAQAQQAAAEEAAAKEAETAIAQLEGERRRQLEAARPQAAKAAPTTPVVPLTPPETKPTSTPVLEQQAKASEKPGAVSPGVPSSVGSGTADDDLEVRSVAATSLAQEADDLIGDRLNAAEILVAELQENYSGLVAELAAAHKAGNEEAKEKITLKARETLVALNAAKNDVMMLHSQHLGWSTPSGGMLTLRDKGRIVFMEDVFTGERPGFIYGQHQGKRGYWAASAKEGPRSQEEADLMELGWCRPEPAKPEPPAQTAPPAPAEKKEAAVAAPKVAGSMDNRAASMAILRLRRNATRVAALPEDIRDAVFNNRDLAMAKIKEHGGVENWVTSTKVALVRDELSTDRSEVVPYTKTQIINMYGAEEGEKLMQQKIKEGNVVDDKNLAGGQLFLIYKESSQNTVTVGKRKSIESASSGQQTEGAPQKRVASGAPAAAKVAPEKEKTQSTEAQQTAAPQQDAEASEAADPEEQDAQPEPKKPKPGKRAAEKLEATTPLERGKSFRDDILKKRNEASTLTTKLTNVAYGSEVKARMKTFSDIFEWRP